MTNLNLSTHSRARRVLRVAVVAILAMVLLAGPAMAQPDNGLAITLAAPTSACPGDRISFTMTLTNDDVERHVVRVELYVLGRDVSGHGIIHEETVSLPEHGLAVVDTSYTVPLPAAHQAINPWDLSVKARVKTKGAGMIKAATVVKVLALTDQACEGGPTPVPLDRE